MKIYKITALTLAAIILTGIVLYLSIDRIIVNFAANKYGLDISYTTIRRSAGEFVLGDLKIFDKRMGLGISSARALIRTEWKGLNIKDTRVNFNLEHVRFVKRHGEKESAAYDSLNGLVAVPFSGNWIYKTITGTVMPLTNGIGIKDFLATGDEIKLSVNGSVFYDNTLDLDTVIYFAIPITKKVPDDLSKVILRDEDTGWKSLAVKLSGNYKTPAIQISGRLFRLSIKSIEGV